MTGSERWLARWLNGTVDIAIAVLLAGLAVTVAITRSDWLPAILDLLACLAAALTVRLPRSAGTGLGIIVGFLLFLPPDWGSLAEYTMLIPILGTGIRGQRRDRLWLTVLYGVLLTALTIHLSEGRGRWIFGVLVWATLIVVLWGIGNLFTAYRTATELNHTAELQQQRLAVARDLHDTVSRDLARASLEAQSARQTHPSADLDAVVRNIQQASTQLRWMLSLLREDAPTTPAGATDQPASEAIRACTESLQAKGFTVFTTIDGDLDELPTALTPTIRAVIGEACANIERHADPARPCTIIVSVDSGTLDALFRNEVRAGTEASVAPGVGLAGLRERLALVGGELDAGREGTQWLSRVAIPL